ncbi:DUF1554 domain-containing protein, partial [Pseudoalteromonas luteoviolacea]|uniref:DUF1554 domain-containing protein n=1 Tax=Pseudoalteromonas luteoviolacea TaxID=43657 RepID=UPI000B32BBF5
KADQTSVDNALAAKADTATVNTQLATKADQTAMDTALAAKADTATINTQLAAKADQTAMDTALAAKADTATINTQLAAKANQDSVNNALAAKADTTTVNAQLAAKADQTAVNNALALKANKNDVLTALDAKVDTTTLNTQLATKADKSAVETALQSTLKFNSSKLLWSAAHAYNKGEVARFSFDGNLYVAIQDVPAGGLVRPNTHASYWTLLIEGSQPTNNKAVFATSQVYSGNLGGTSGADAKCQSLADSSDAMPSGVYKALLSTSSTLATSVIKDEHIYMRVDGRTVATGSTLLSSIPQWEIDLDENGNSVSGHVWTNTNRFGQRLNWSACSNFNSSSGLDMYSGSNTAAAGVIGTGSFTWLNSTFLTCDNNARLYCVQQ